MNVLTQTEQFYKRNTIILYRSSAVGPSNRDLVLLHTKMAPINFGDDDNQHMLLSESSEKDPS